jgi:hypothetical protein
MISFIGGQLLRGNQREDFFRCGKAQKKFSRDEG